MPHSPREISKTSTTTHKTFKEKCKNFFAKLTPKFARAKKNFEEDVLSNKTPPLPRHEEETDSSTHHNKTPHGSGINAASRGSKIDKLKTDEPINIASFIRTATEDREGDFFKVSSFYELIEGHAGSDPKAAETMKALGQIGFEGLTSE